MGKSHLRTNKKSGLSYRFSVRRFVTKAGLGLLTQETTGISQIQWRATPSGLVTAADVTH